MVRGQVFTNLFWLLPNNEQFRIIREQEERLLRQADKWGYHGSFRKRHREFVQRCGRYGFVWIGSKIVRLSDGTNTIAYAEQGKEVA